MERTHFAIVTWEPMLHLLTPGDCGAYAQIWFNRTTTHRTACRQDVTGYLDDALEHVVTCLTCLVVAGWR